MFSIVPLHSEQAAQLAQFFARTFYDTYAAFNTESDMNDYLQTHFTTAHLQAEFEEIGTQFFGIVAQGNLIAALKLRRQTPPESVKITPALEISRIYVDAAHQGKQLGYALIQHTLAIAAQENCQAIWLQVWQQNPKAIAFYERVGFSIIATCTFVLGNDTQDDFLMLKQMNK